MMNIYAEYCREGAATAAVARMLTIYIEEAHAADEVQ